MPEVVKRRAKSAHHLPVKQRLETFFEKRGEDECWNWLGYLNRKGYGSFRIGSFVDKSHRASYRVYKGEIASGLHVLHSCDNPRCVNPKHLSVGSNLKNQQEAWGRFRKNNVQKVSAAAVLEIRGSNLLQSVLSEQFGVHQSQICRLQKGRRGHGILRQLDSQMGGLSRQ